MRGPERSRASDDAQAVLRQLSFVNGAPPKVVWLEVGNAGTAAILDLLRRGRGTLERFRTEAEAALLIVSLSIRAV